MLGGGSGKTEDEHCTISHGLTSCEESRSWMSRETLHSAFDGHILSQARKNDAFQECCRVTKYHRRNGNDRQHPSVNQKRGESPAKTCWRSLGSWRMNSSEPWETRVGDKAHFPASGRGQSGCFNLHWLLGNVSYPYPFSCQVLA